MGEACIRSNVSHGDGVYRSTDAGATWKHVGLDDTRHIARVRVDPRDPDRLYVAALGHAFGPNAQRGVFRSKDGGRTWERVLFKSERAGAIDLSIDPHNPRILYAAIWQALRTPWSFVGAGPESGLWRSTDGGDTWTDLTERPGDAGRDQGPHRGRGVAGPVGARVGHSGGRGRRAAALGRRRRHVGARQRQPAGEAAPLLSPPHLRPPDQGRHDVDTRDTRAEVGQRRAVVHDEADDPQRQPRPVDRPARPAEDDRGQRRRRVRLIRRRRDVVDDIQPAHGPVLPRGRRHTAPVPRLRHPAGQQRDQHAKQVDQGRNPLRRQLRRGVLGEWAYRGATRQPRHRLLRRSRQRAGRRGRPHQVQPRLGGVTAHHRVAGDLIRAGRAGHAVPLPVDLPDSHIAPRRQRALRRRQQGLPVHGRRDDLGGGVAGPHA